MERHPVDEDDRVFQSSSGILEFILCQYRMHCLYEFYELGKTAVHKYLAEENAELRTFMNTRDLGISKFEDGDEIDLNTFRAEMTESRQTSLYIHSEYLPVSLYSGVIAQLLSLLEALMHEVASLCANTRRIQLELDGREMPYVDKFLLFLTRDCGLKISLDRNLQKKLNSIREVRNRYVHKLGQDLPEEAKERIRELFLIPNTEPFKVDERFVEEAFQVVTDIMSRIEKSYDEWSST